MFNSYRTLTLLLSQLLPRLTSQGSSYSLASRRATGSLQVFEIIFARQVIDYYYYVVIKKS